MFLKLYLAQVIYQSVTSGHVLQKLELLKWFNILHSPLGQQISTRKNWMGKFLTSMLLFFNVSFFFEVKVGAAYEPSSQ